MYAEAVLGSDRLDLEILINERFSPTSRFSFLSVTDAQGQQHNTTNSFDFVNTSQVSYDLYKGFGVNLGFSLNGQVGFNTTAGVQYVYAKPSLLIVISPVVFLSGDHDFQNVLVAKFEPALSEKWRLYESVETFDDYDRKLGIEVRHFVHARTGATYKRFTFGVGADFDWYGLPKSYRTNYGPFVGYSF